MEKPASGAATSHFNAYLCSLAYIGYYINPVFARKNLFFCPKLYVEFMKIFLSIFVQNHIKLYAVPTPILIMGINPKFYLYIVFLPDLP